MDKDRQKEKLSKFGERYGTIGIVGCGVTADKLALADPIIPNLEIAKLMPKINTKSNQTKNQQKRCAKGLHQYRRTEEKQEDSNMIKVVWVCDCGEVEKHYRNK